MVDYCCNVCGTASKTHLDELYKLQKRAAKIIFKINMDSPSRLILKN